MSKRPASFCLLVSCSSGRIKIQHGLPCLSEVAQNGGFRLPCGILGDTLKANVAQSELKYRALFLMTMYVPNFLEICCFKGSKSSSLIAALQCWIGKISCLPRTQVPTPSPLWEQNWTRITYLAKYTVVNFFCLQKNFRICNKFFFFNLKLCYFLILATNNILKEKLRQRTVIPSFCKAERVTWGTDGGGKEPLGVFLEADIEFKLEK